MPSTNTAQAQSGVSAPTPSSGAVSTNAHEASTLPAKTPTSMRGLNSHCCCIGGTSYQREPSANLIESTAADARGDRFMFSRWCALAVLQVACIGTPKDEVTEEALCAWYCGHDTISFP